MKNQIFKMLYKQRKKKIALVIEIFCMFIAFCIVFGFIIQLKLNAHIPLGFKYKNIYSIFIDTPEENWEEIKQTKQDILDYLSVYPGVKHIGFSYSSFFFDRGHMNPYRDLKYKKTEIPAEEVELFGIKDDLAQALGIKLHKGRWFNKEDDAAKYRPAVINQILKEKMFGDSIAIGELINYCDQLCQVVGVCYNFKHKGEFSQTEAALIIRHSDDDNLPYETSYCMSGDNCGYMLYMSCKDNLPETFEYDISTKISTLFPGFNLLLNPLEKQHQKYVRSTWFPIIVVLAFILFLFITILFGLFGVLWYNISLRKSEIGLRMAVGASKKNVYKQFIGEMLALATLGILPGLIIAAQFPILKVFDIETKVYILAILAATGIIYLLVTLCALLPSAQAANIQPAMALHEE